MDFGRSPGSQEESPSYSVLIFSLLRLGCVIVACNPLLLLAIQRGELDRIGVSALGLAAAAYINPFLDGCGVAALPATDE